MRRHDVSDTACSRFEGCIAETTRERLIPSVHMSMQGETGLTSERLEANRAAKLNFICGGIEQAKRQRRHNNVEHSQRVNVPKSSANLIKIEVLHGAISELHTSRISARAYLLPQQRVLQVALIVLKGNR